MNEQQYAKRNHGYKRLEQRNSDGSDNGIEYEMGKTLCLAIICSVACATAGIVLANFLGVL